MTHVGVYDRRHHPVSPSLHHVRPILSLGSVKKGVPQMSENHLHLLLDILVNRNPVPFTDQTLRKRNSKIDRTGQRKEEMLSRGPRTTCIRTGLSVPSEGLIDILSGDIVPESTSESPFRTLLFDKNYSSSTWSPVVSSRTSCILHQTVS